MVDITALDRRPRLGVPDYSEPDRLNTRPTANHAPAANGDPDLVDPSMQLQSLDGEVSGEWLALFSASSARRPENAPDFASIGAPLASTGRVPLQFATSRPNGSSVRGEVQTDADVQHPGQWTRDDRLNNTARWREANLYNLQNGNSGRYETIDQRRDFYRWFYEHSVDEGYETRWPLAASIVANGAYEVAYPGVSGEAAGSIPNELQGAMRIGNQVIFDDAFPKLQALLDDPALTGQDALQWDMQTLSEEQALVQPMYNVMSQQTQDRMEEIAKKKGFLLNAVLFFTDADDIEERPGPDGQMGTSDDYNRSGTVPGLTGNIDNPRDRWTYGMQLGNQFAPRPTGYTSGTPMPDPRPQYTDGSAFNEVSDRGNLHMLDAEIDVAMGLARYSRIRTFLGNLSGAEAAELARDVRPEQSPGRSEPLRYSEQLGLLIRLTREEVAAALPNGSDKDAFMARFDAVRQHMPPPRRRH